MNSKRKSGHDTPEFPAVTAGVEQREYDRTRRASPVVGIRVHRPGEGPLVLSLERHRHSTVLVGRGTNVEVRVNDTAISRVHGFLRGDVNVWVYVDAGSSNGSYVEDGDRRVRLRAGEPVVLSVGQDILLGSQARIEPLAQMPLSQVNAGTRSAVGLEFELLLSSVAPSTLPVFLLGRSGSGKTWAARVLHDRSPRRDGPFIALNCARLPQDPSQLQSALLGHVKGAFTGADSDSVGAFFAADKGTLFLDEVESLSELAQGFLLDVLEETGQLLPLGASMNKPRPRPRVRVISASKKQLTRSKLRADLCHRLAQGELIEVPLLRHRSDDIPGLVKTFVHDFVESRNVDLGSVSFSADAVEALCKAPWDGEVRELRATVETLVDRALRGRPIIEVDAVNERLAALRTSHGSAPGHAKDFADEEETFTTRRPTASFRLAETELDGRAVRIPLHKLNPRTATAADIEAALAEAGSIDGAAVLLRWARNTLTKKMDEFGLRKRPVAGDDTPH
jgi:DNA-binding NtrC family response regulator